MRSIWSINTLDHSSLLKFNFLEFWKHMTKNVIEHRRYGFFLMCMKLNSVGCRVYIKIHLVKYLCLPIVDFVLLRYLPNCKRVNDVGKILRRLIGRWEVALHSCPTVCIIIVLIFLTFLFKWLFLVLELHNL